MKTDRYFASTVACTLTALTVGCVISALAQTATQLPSTVVRLKGHARCKTDNNAPWRMIKAGELIYPGSLIETAQGSEMDLLLGEQVKPTRASAKADLYNPEIHPGNVVRLGADSALWIDKLTRKPAEGLKGPVEETMLELRAGTIQGSVRRQGNESAYEIAFAGGVVGMKETVYGLSSKGELSVLKGTACIALTDGKPASTVAAEEQFNPSTGAITKLARLPATSDGARAPAGPDPKRPAIFTPVSPAQRPF